jgi:hypothetical protein
VNLCKGPRDEYDLSWDGRVLEWLLLTERDFRLFLRNSAVLAMCQVWETKCQVVFVDPQRHTL